MQVTRKANRDDFYGIKDVAKFLGYTPLDDLETKRKLQALLDSSSDEVYVFEIDHTIVGWIHVRKMEHLASKDFYEIINIVIDHKMQRRGIGRNLVRYVLKKHNANFRVRSNKERMSANKFYKALGFTVTKAQNVYDLSSL